MQLVNKGKGICTKKMNICNYKIQMQLDIKKTKIQLYHTQENNYMQEYS